MAGTGEGKEGGIRRGHYNLNMGHFTDFVRRKRGHKTYITFNSKTIIQNTSCFVSYGTIRTYTTYNRYQQGHFKTDCKLCGCMTPQSPVEPEKSDCIPYFMSTIFYTQMYMQLSFTPCALCTVSSGLRVGMGHRRILFMGPINVLNRPRWLFPWGVMLIGYFVVGWMLRMLPLPDSRQGMVLH
jgi:hypothetical protein